MSEKRTMHIPLDGGSMTVTVEGGYLIEEMLMSIPAAEVGHMIQDALERAKSDE